MPSLCLRAAGGAVLFLLVLFTNAITAPLAAAETEWITIQSIPPEDVFPPPIIDRLNEHSTNLTQFDRAAMEDHRILIKVVTPAGTGPFPVIVGLHGCSGVKPKHYKSMEHWILSVGYAVVWVDSYQPRGLSETCVGKKALVLTVRSADAYATLFHLVANSKKYGIDPRRVVLSGASAGGSTTLWAMKNNIQRRIARTRGAMPRFAGGIALYPGCKGKRPAFYNPVSIIIGELDQDTPAEDCEKWAKTSPDPRSARLDVHILPDAFHGFDSPGNEITGSEFNGHHVEYNPLAEAKAHEIMLAFLRNLDVTAAEKGAAAEKLRRALAGNTLHLKMRNGRTGFQYFSPDGRAPLTVVGRRNFADLRWRMDDDGRLCRTRPRDGREDCLQVTIDGDAVVLSRPGGKAGETGVLLKGNQLPKSTKKDRRRGRDRNDGGRDVTKIDRPAQEGGDTGKRDDASRSAPFLSEVELRTAIIGNTVAFISPSSGSDMRIYFAPDGQVELKAKGASRDGNRQQWSFKDGGRLCRARRNGRENCIRAQREPETDVLTFVGRRNSYRVTVSKGKQLSE